MTFTHSLKDSASIGRADPSHSLRPIWSYYQRFVRGSRGEGNFLRRHLNALLSSFQKTQADDMWKAVKLTFLRNETWEN
jgi:hypothetical protein